MADRFKKIYSQGAMTQLEVWVDTETGVNYLWRAAGYAGGLTPLLDKDGKPVISYSLDKGNYRKEYEK